MKRVLLIVGVVAFGCSSGEPPKPVPVEPPVVVAVLPTPPDPPKPPPPEPFCFPADRAGKQVERTLLPAPPVPALSGVTGPKPRTSDVGRGEPPLAKPSPVVAPSPGLPARRTPGPSVVSEGVSGEFGPGPMDLSGFKLPDAKPVRVEGKPKPSAADLPPLARQWTQRAPTDDPSAELVAERIVRTLLLAPVLNGPLLRLTVPDPFELANQVRPPAGPELGTTPVEVPPARP